MDGFEKYPLGSKWMLEIEGVTIPVHIAEHSESLSQGKMLFVVSDTKGDDMEAYGICQTLDFFKDRLKEAQNG